jgi:hypothetical protein
MLAALALARSILSLAPEVASLLTALVNAIRGHDAKTQRIIMDAAFAAAEDIIAVKVRGR